MKLRLFFFIGIFSFCYAQSDRIVFTPRLQILLDDMKLYKLDAEGELYLHAGDLYEHSVWAYNAAWEILDDSSPYMQGFFLTERQKEIVALAALLHDIGKAGRFELFEHTHPTLRYDVIKHEDNTVDYVVYFVDYQTHPHIGFEYSGKHFFAPDVKGFVPQYYYLIHKRTGQLEEFDFAQLFCEIGLTKEEQKIVAILIGIHYEFGNLKYAKITQEEFLSLIEDLVKVVDYNHGELDELIVRLSILIQVIDVKGLILVPAKNSSLFPEGIHSDVTHFDLKFEDPFLAFEYATRDQSTPFAINLMLRILDTYYSKTAEKDIKNYFIENNFLIA